MAAAAVISQIAVVVATPLCLAAQRGAVGVAPVRAVSAAMCSPPVRVRRSTTPAALMRPGPAHSPRPLPAAPSLWCLLARGSRAPTSPRERLCARPEVPAPSAAARALPLWPAPARSGRAGARERAGAAADPVVRPPSQSQYARAGAARRRGALPRALGLPLLLSVEFVVCFVLCSV